VDYAAMPERLFPIASVLAWITPAALLILKAAGS
jgi:hypothetical protein